MMALADNGDVLVPNVGTSSVLRFAALVAARRRLAVPGRGLPPQQGARVDVREDVPFPAGVAKDPTCDCFAVSSYIGNPSIRWVTGDGQPEPGRGSVPGTTIADLGKSPGPVQPVRHGLRPRRDACTSSTSTSRARRC